MDTEAARRKLGHRIRSLRKERSLTIRALAARAGLSSDYIVDIEFGRKSATFNTLLRVSSGLDVNMADLFEGIDVSGLIKARTCASDYPHSANLC